MGKQSAESARTTREPSPPTSSPPSPPSRPARVVAADSLPIRRAARGLAAIVAERSNASAARTAAARALWSLCLAEGDGAAAVDAAPGAVAALAGALAETTVPTLCPYEDNTTRSGSDDEFRRRVSSSETTFASYAMRAAAAGALGAVFSGAAADSRDPTRALRCVNAAFDVEGASRGFADVARGGDADGALAAAAAVAAATRVPAGAARVAADEALLAALCDVAGAEENIDTDAVGARAAEALANLAAHTSSVEVLASSPAASTLWLEAATLLFASRQAETRAAIVGAARSFLRRTGKQSGAAEPLDARFARAVADRLADQNERLSTRVDAAGCASLIATSVYGTREEPRSSKRWSPRSVSSETRRRRKPARRRATKATRETIRSGKRGSGSSRVSPRPRRETCARVSFGTKTKTETKRAESSPRTVWHAPRRKPPGRGASAAPTPPRRRRSRRRSSFWLAARGALGR
jgi:hypothetical protein